MRFDLELPSQHAASHRVAVLLINLGTPDAPDMSSGRRAELEPAGTPS